MTNPPTNSPTNSPMHQPDQQHDQQHDQQPELSLYQQIGGAPTVRGVTADLYRRIVADDLLGPVFDGYSVPEIEAHQRKLFGMILGGSERYDVARLEGKHAPLHLTGAHVDRLQVLTAASLTSLAAPDAVLAAVHDAIEQVRPLVVHPAAG